MIEGGGAVVFGAARCEGQQLIDVASQREPAGDVNRFGVPRTDFLDHDVPQAHARDDAQGPQPVMMRGRSSCLAPVISGQVLSPSSNSQPGKWSRC